MAIELQSFLEVIEDSYSAYYNIIKEDLPSDLPIAFRADYYQRGEQYWLMKSIPIWGNETNEFAYVFCSKSFDGEMVDKCIDYALEEGLPRVKPHKEHQYTNIKTIFLADEFSDEAVKKIKKSNFSKSYNHSLWGFTNLIVCGADVDNEKVHANKYANGMPAYFKKLFAAQHKDS